MLRVAAEEADRADALVGSASALSHYQTNTDADEVPPPTLWWTRRLRRVLSACSGRCLLQAPCSAPKRLSLQVNTVVQKDTLHLRAQLYRGNYRC